MCGLSSFPESCEGRCDTVGLGGWQVAACEGNPMEVDPSKLGSRVLQDLGEGFHKELEAA